MHGDTTWVTCSPSHPSSLAPTYSHLPGTTLITFSIFTNTAAAIYVPEYKLIWMKIPCMVDRLSSTGTRVLKQGSNREQQHCFNSGQAAQTEDKNTAPREENNISPTEDKQLKLARPCSKAWESKQGPNCAQTAQAPAKSCESKHLWKKTWNPSHHSVQTSWVLSENTSLGFPARVQTSHVPVHYFSTETISLISILFWLPKKTQGNFE